MRSQVASVSKGPDFNRNSRPLRPTSGLCHCLDQWRTAIDHTKSPNLRFPTSACANCRGEQVEESAISGVSRDLRIDSVGTLNATCFAVRQPPNPRLTSAAGGFPPVLQLLGSRLRWNSAVVVKVRWGPWVTTGAIFVPGKSWQFRVTSPTPKPTSQRIKNEKHWKTRDSMAMCIYPSWRSIIVQSTNGRSCQWGRLSLLGKFHPGHFARTEVNCAKYTCRSPSFEASPFQTRYFADLKQIEPSWRRFNLLVIP